MTNVRQNWYPAILMALAAAAPSFAENAAPSMETFAKLPLAFERNQGQADSRVAFMAHGIAYSVFLTKQEAVLTLAGPEGRSNVLRMGLASADPNPAISGLERLAGQSNYLIGNDHTKWHTGVLSFGRVRYEGVYPGIDLVYYGNRGQLEYDFLAAPGSDPSRIRLRFAGARRMRVAADGDLVLAAGDRKSTRLNSSHLLISYAVFCLKKKFADFMITILRLMMCGHQIYNSMLNACAQISSVFVGS